MDYLKLLEESYREQQREDALLSRLEYLSVHVFDFTTYDSSLDDFFAEKALEVCRAITVGETFEYIKDDENYKWFVAMCNMPFFADKIDWGGSIRGAWWSMYGGFKFEIESCGLWQDGRQLKILRLDAKNWLFFLEALDAFANDGRNKEK